MTKQSRAKNANSKVIPLNRFNPKRMKSKLLSKRLSADGNEMVGMLNRMFYLTACAGPGKDVVDSFNPYVRIHSWRSFVSDKTLSMYRVEVSCHDVDLAEWIIPDVSAEETRRRLLSIGGKRPEIPWDQIDDGDDWYALLDPTSRYWKLLEAEVLKAPTTELSRRNLESRGWLIEKFLRIEKAQTSLRRMRTK